MKQAKEFLTVFLLVVIGLILGKQLSVLLEKQGVKIVGGVGII